MLGSYIAVVFLSFLMVSLWFLVKIKRELTGLKSGKQGKSIREELDATIEELKALNDELEKKNQLLENEIEEHKRTQQEKSILEEKFKNFIDQSTDLISIVSQDGTIEAWNKVSEEYTGIKQSDAIGKSIWDIEPLIIPEYRKSQEADSKIKAKVAEYLNNIENVTPRYSDGEYEKPGGEKYFIHVLFFPILTPFGTYVGRIGRDITKEKKAELQLMDYQKELETLIEKQSEKMFQLSERLKDIYFNTSDAITFFDILEDNKSLKVFDMNSKARDFFSISSVDIENGLFINDLYPENTLSKFYNDIYPQLIKGDAVSTKDKETLRESYWQTLYLPSVNQDGKIYRITSYSRNITAEMKTAQLSAILDSAIESWPFEFWICDNTGKCILQNKASYNTWGNLIGNSPTDLDAPEDIKQKTINLTQSALNGISTSSEFTFKTKNGDRHVLMNLHPVKINNINNGFLGIAIDITERKKIENSIKESEENYRLLAENIEDVIWKIELSHFWFTYSSQSVLALTGYTTSEILRTRLEKLLQPDSFDYFSEDIKERVKRYKNDKTISRIKDYELKLKNKKGHILYIEFNTTLIVDFEGNINEFVATSRDISGRKLAEMSLRHSEERFRTIARLSKSIFYDIDIASGKIQWDGAVMEVTGYSPDEYDRINFEDWLNMIHPDDRALVYSQYMEAQRNLSPYKSNYRYENKQKEYRWVEVDCKFVVAQYNKSERLLGVMRDITEQRKAQETIRENEQKLSTIYNASKDGIVLLNNRMEVIDINRSAMIKSGYSFNDIRGKNISSILSVDGMAQLQHHLKLIWSVHELDNFETEIILKSGKILPVEISSTPIIFNNQNALLLMIRDISERKKLERELLNAVIKTEEQERLYFSQELHDGLGPLLSAAKMYIEWMSDSSSNVDIKTLIPDVMKILEESNKSIRDISFKLSPHILQNFGIPEALKAYSSKVVKSGKTQIVVQQNDIGRLDSVLETLIYRILCECINNSLKHANARLINISFEMENKTLNICYSDDGKGFDVEKALHDRKGVGLLNMQSRIKSVKGFFNIQSEIGKGTTIVFKFPVNI